MKLRKKKKKKENPKTKKKAAEKISPRKEGQFNQPTRNINLRDKNSTIKIFLVNLKLKFYCFLDFCINE